MLTRLYTVAACLLAVCSCASAQESNFGISVPVTISGDARYATGALATSGGGDATAGFRASVYPSLRLGDHWFFYAALDFYSSSYFPYRTGLDDNQHLQFDVRQAYLGYATAFGSASVAFKAGQLASGFGLLPIDYDDANTPFVTPPAIYSVGMPLRPDQLPCGLPDIWWQSYGGGLDFHCGGSTGGRYPMDPVTLLGLPGVGVETSWHRVDARIQITNSSPANPQTLLSGSQFAQWTAGAGYSARGGLHFGVSGYRGPYLDQVVAPFLPSGTRLQDFQSSGVGADMKWSHGAFSTQGEWQHFGFEVPNFPVSPSEQAAYGQVKIVLTPRAFVAARASTVRYGRAQDNSGSGLSQFAASQENLTFSAGYRFNRLMLLKTEYGWTHLDSWSGGWFWPSDQGNVVSVQLVTSFTAISQAFR